MALKVDVAGFVDKHARRLKASEPDIRAGLARVTIAPGVQAGAKQDKMRSRLLAKIDDGTWKTRVSAVPLETWRTKATDVGVPRIATGIDAAKDKMTSFASQLLPHIETVRNKVITMPDLTLEDGIARSSAMIRGMAQFRKK